MVKLSEGIKHNKKIQHINLFHNNICGHGITTFANALKSDHNESKIKWINLAKQNYISSEQGMELAEGLWLAKNPPQHIDLSLNFFDEQTGKMLADAVENQLMIKSIKADNC